MEVIVMATRYTRHDARTLLDATGARSGAEFLACFIRSPGRGDEAWHVLAAGRTADQAARRLADQPGQLYAFALERLVVADSPWPRTEPDPARRWRIEPGSFVVLVPSIALPADGPSWISRKPTLLARLISSSEGESDARARLDALGVRALLGRVVRLIELYDKADLDFVQRDGTTLRCG